jgi:hypothetical protein
MRAASRDLGHPSGGGRMVYRPAYSRVLLGIFVVFGLWWVIDEAIGPHPAHAAVSGLWLVAITAALACLFWRPSVVVDESGVELRNMVRDVQMPWRALEQLETRYTLTLHAGGRRYQSWAGVAPGRPSITARLISGRVAGAADSGRYDYALPDPRRTAAAGGAAPSSRDLRADSGATAFMIEQRWHAWRDRAGAAGESSPDRQDGSTHRPPGDRPVVLVRWRPLLPVVSGVAAVLALALTQLLS